MQQLRYGRADTVLKLRVLKFRFLIGVFQKSSHVSKLATSANFLTIYRWAQLALDLSNDHELVFLVWQKFFLRYFHRVSEYASISLLNSTICMTSKPKCFLSAIKQRSTVVWRVDFLKG